MNARLRQTSTAHAVHTQKITVQASVNRRGHLCHTELIHKQKLVQIKDQSANIFQSVLTHVRNNRSHLIFGGKAPQCPKIELFHLGFRIARSLLNIFCKFARHFQHKRVVQQRERLLRRDRLISFIHLHRRICTIKCRHEGLLL